MRFSLLKIFAPVFLILFSSLSLKADALEEAEKFISERQFSKAKLILNQIADQDPALANNSNYILLSGICEWKTGDFSDAKILLEKARNKGNARANLLLGKIAAEEYSFDKALSLLNSYKTTAAKNATQSEEVDLAIRQVMNAKKGLERVEKIIVIDSIAVPRNDFFNYYKLPDSSGKFISGNSLPKKEFNLNQTVAFINETEDYIIFSQKDSANMLNLAESYVSLPSDWEEPRVFNDFLQNGGNAAYPFMMGDGLILYFASDGEGSMGGYDIFRTSRDSSNDDFLQPINIGMPFNSPADDYLMAIDEENGIGWWATDRNHLGDKLTIYVFKVNDIRNNYEPEEGDIINHARIQDFKSTWDSDISGYKKTLNSIKQKDKTNKKIENTIVPIQLNGNKKITSYQDLRKTESKSLMDELIQNEKEERSLSATLLKLRKQYASGSTGISDEIKSLELQYQQIIEKIQFLRNEIRRIETGK